MFPMQSTTSSKEVDCVKVMIDVDDVLTNFNRAFLEISNLLFGTPLDVEITVWEFHKCVPGLDYEKEMQV